MAAKKAKKSAKKSAKRFTRLTKQAVAELGLSVKEADRCKNFFAMGLVYWLYGRNMDATLRYINGKFGDGTSAIAKANEKALRAGWKPGPAAWLQPTLFNPDLDEIRQTAPFQKLVRQYLPEQARILKME